MNQNKKLLTSSMEDYLEMIYRHSLQTGYIRIINLSDYLNVRPSSASKMVQKLKTLELVNYEKYGIIYLTDAGREIGKFLLLRHNAVEDFLRMIGVTENVLTDTELIEHSLGIKTLEKLIKFTDFLKENPQIVKKFNEF